VLWGTRSLLAELQSTLSPVPLALFVILSILCGFGLVLAAWAIRARREWARIVAPTSMISYFVIVQVYTVLFVRTGLMWERRWGSLVLSAIALSVSIGALTWPRSRHWLGLS
jgi:hypothetical protein